MKCHSVARLEQCPLLLRAIRAGYLAGYGPCAMPLFALCSRVYALVDGSERDLVSDPCTEGLRRSALGLCSGALGVAAIASSLLAGAIWEWWGAQAAFLFGAGAAGLAAAGMLMWTKRTEGNAMDILLEN
jgi:hypothetical protein